MILLGGPTLASTRPKIKSTIWRYKDQKCLGVRKRINTTVKSTYQSSIYVECTVYTNNIHSKIQDMVFFFFYFRVWRSQSPWVITLRIVEFFPCTIRCLVIDTRLWHQKVPGSSPNLTESTLNPFETPFTNNSSPHLGVKSVLD